jgi:hypothetical protein
VTALYFDTSDCVHRFGIRSDKRHAPSIEFFCVLCGVLGFERPARWREGVPVLVFECLDSCTLDARALTSIALRPPVPTCWLHSNVGSVRPR